MKSIAGIGRRSRQRLGIVLSNTHGSIRVDDVTHILQIKRPQATKLLYNWSRNGWIARVRRGLYVPLSIETSSTSPVLEEPWSIATRAFDPCYIGGWSAAEYWDFTDQIFQTVRVVTSKPLGRREQKVGETRYRVKRLDKRYWFGLQTVWKDGSQVLVSDPTRTIVDALSDPDLLGGFTMVESVFTEYLRSEHANLDLLVDYCNRIGNRTVFKRLGILIEWHMPDNLEIMKMCRERMSKGYSKLDPALEGSRIVTRWRLRVPESFLKRRR